MATSKKVGFWNEGVNVRSVARLLSTVLIFTGCLIALVEVGFAMYKYRSTVDNAYEVHVALILGLVGAGGGTKIIQKIFGEKPKDEGNNEVA